MSRRTSIFVNLIVAVASFFFLYETVAQWSGQRWPVLHEHAFYAGLVVVAFLFVHVLKLLRFYVILLELKIPIARFIELYVKTTYVNMIFPLKIGEFFRIYCYGQQVKNFKIGLLSVLVDRFFDTCVLLVVLVPYEILKYKTLSGISLVSLLLVCGFLFVYHFFPATYKYLNQFLILRGMSKRTLLFLEYLEHLKEWYLYVQRLVRGRASILLLLSGTAWMFEYFMLWGLAKLYQGLFGMTDFLTYLNSAFTGTANDLFAAYLSMGVIVFFIVTLLIYLRSYWIRGEKSYGQAHVRRR